MHRKKIDQGRACVRRSAPLHFPVKSSQDWVCSPCTPIIELKLCIFSQVKGELQRQVGVRLVNRFEEVWVEYLKGDARPRSRHQVSTDIPHPSHSRETSRLAYLFSNEPENNETLSQLLTTFMSIISFIRGLLPWGTRSRHLDGILSNQGTNRQVQILVHLETEYTVVRDE